MKHLVPITATLSQTVQALSQASKKWSCGGEPRLKSNIAFLLNGGVQIIRSVNIHPLKIKITFHCQVKHGTGKKYTLHVHASQINLPHLLMKTHALPILSIKRAVRPSELSWKLKTHLIFTADLPTGSSVSLPTSHVPFTSRAFHSSSCTALHSAAPSHSRLPLHSVARSCSRSRPRKQTFDHHPPCSASPKRWSSAVREHVLPNGGA